MDILTIVILSLCGALAGFCVAYFVVNNVVLKKKKAQILKEAETEGENIKITLKSPTQAITIEPAEEDENFKYFYMILPVRMNEQK